MDKLDCKKLQEKGEQIVKVDDKKAIRYKVVEEVIDLEALRQELEGWETMGESSKEQLMEYGKMNSPYFTVREERIKQLKAQLAEVK